MSLELDGGPYDVHARRGSILLDGDHADDDSDYSDGC